MKNEESLRCALRASVEYVLRSTYTWRRKTSTNSKQDMTKQEQTSKKIYMACRPFMLVFTFLFPASRHYFWPASFFVVRRLE